MRMSRIVVTRMIAKQVATRTTNNMLLLLLVVMMVVLGACRHRSYKTSLSDVAYSTSTNSKISTCSGCCYYYSFSASSYCFPSEE